MRVLRVPEGLVGGVAPLKDIFVVIATTRRLPQEKAEQAFNMLPKEIQSAICFLDRLTGLWRYDFGNPFDRLPDGILIYGTQMYQPVEYLFNVVLCAAERLTHTQFADYMNRLADPNKHKDLRRVEEDRFRLRYPLGCVRRFQLRARLGSP